MEYEYLTETAGSNEQAVVIENVARYLEREYLMRRVKSRSEIDNDSFMVTSGAGVSVWTSLDSRAMVCKAIGFFSKALDGKYGFHGDELSSYSVWQVRPTGRKARRPTGPGFGKGVWRVNDERKQIEVSLDKDDTDTRSKVKAAGFRWFHDGGFWYAKDCPALRKECGDIGLKVA
jgi:hypothetical protein